MKNSGIDNLKLRASWGKLGNNSIGNYEYIPTYASGFEYSFGNKLASGIVQSLSNSALTWETTTSTDIGHQGLPLWGHSQLHPQLELGQQVQRPSECRLGG